VVLTLCHPLDYLRWLFGEVVQTAAFSGHLSDLEVDTEDLAEILLRFESGMIGSVHLDYCQRPGSHRMEIICTQGTIRWDNADGAVQVYQAADERWRFTRRRRALSETFVHRSDSPLLAVVREAGGLYLAGWG
jgi:predicted dehydrogenase